MASGSPILTVAQMQWVDRQTIAAGTPGLRLMQRAGEQVARAALSCKPDGGRVVIVAGGGNNGGDGYAAAMFLSRHNVPVTVVATVAPDNLRGDAAEQVRLAQQARVKIRLATGPRDCELLVKWLARSCLVVDAIFGTGLSRPVDGWLREVVDRINASDRPVLAVDIASGVNGDRGEVMGASVQATWTLPIAAYKWGHWLGAGRDTAGILLPPADIGMDDTVIRQSFQAVPAACRSAALVDRPLIRAAFPCRARRAHKGHFGHVWVFGGSHGYTGAPRLAAMGVLAAGGGLVSIACPDEVYPVVAASSLEVMVHAESKAPWQQADMIVAGPGWGRKKAKSLEMLLDSGRPLVLDADALNILAASEHLAAALGRRPALTVLTPHPGEAGRLLGMTADEIQEDRLHAVLALCQRFSCWVVLKGADTLIASPQGDVWLNPHGSPRLASAGSGDVLSGMIAAVLARGITPDVGIPAVVALHALAGEQSGWYRAGQLSDIVAALRQDLESGPMAGASV